MKKNIITGVLLLLALYTYAQNTLKGKVSSTDGNPLSKVSVYIPSLEKGSYSNENGEFIIQNIPSGNYSVIFRFLGYQSKYLTLSITEQEVSVTVTLEPGVIEMEEIVLSTPFHKKQKENVVKVEIAALNKLKEEGVVSLSEGLRSIPGVSTLTTGLGIAKPVIRGLTGNRILVYTQDVRLENQQFGDEHGLGVNESGIKSVEVIKGPASLLYGSDALGGIVYINPESYALSNTSSTDIQTNYFSNTLGLNTNIGFKKSYENLKFLVRLGNNTHGDYRTGNEKKVTNSRFNNYDIKAGLGYSKNNIHTSFRYNYSDNRVGIPHGIEEQTNNRSLIDPKQNIFSSILSNTTKIIFDNSSLEFNLGYTFNNRKEFEGEEEHEGEEEEEEEEEEHGHGGEAALNNNLKTLGYNAKYLFNPTEKINLITGVQGMFQTNKNLGEEILIPDADVKDIGVFAVSHYHFSSTNDILFGVRFDHRNISSTVERRSINNNFNSFTGSAGWRSDINEAWISRINIASGFRSPNLSELTSNGVHHGTNRFEIGDINLKREQNIQLDFSLEHHTKHVEIFANAFYNTINNYIYLKPSGTRINNRMVFNYVQNNANLYGGELAFHFHPHPLDWLHVESNVEWVEGRLKNNNFLPLIPPISISNTLKVDFNLTENVNHLYGFINLKSYLAQNNVDEFETKSPAFNLWSVGVGTNVYFGKKILKLHITTTNLFNESYIAHLSRLKSDNVQNIGRNINFGLRLNL